MVWHGYTSDGSGFEIFLYDGNGIKRLTDNAFDDEYPQISNSGYVVWPGWDGSDYEIFLYDGSGISQITHNSYDDFDPYYKCYPQITEAGEITWFGWDGSDYEIYVAKPSAYPAAANFLAASYGRGSLTTSGVFNELTILLFPLGILLLLRKFQSCL